MEHAPVSLNAMRALAAEFEIAGEVVESAPYGSGHINDTYAVVFRQATGTRRYILQRVNHLIFKNVPALMENVCRVTEHIRGKLAAMPGSDPDRETLTVIPTHAGTGYYEAPDGNFWRAYLFIENARTYDVPSGSEQIFEAARAFGRFQSLLADLPPPPLHETIVNFHHTPMRFETLKQAIDDDVCGRVPECREAIDFALEREPMTARVTDALDAGALPLRVTHNDTKINNVMLDDATGRGVCVIDLDTVMPGSLLYDFGDQARTMTGDFEENERDLGRVYAKLDRFEALVRGAMESGRESMTPLEIEWLPFGGRLITFTIGIRFLTDFLQGDVYFKTGRPGENLDRTRTQFALVKSMEAQNDAMREIIGRYS